MTADAKIRVLLVDDHAAVRRGLRHLLAAQGDMVVVGEAGNGTDALRLAPELEPDVILLDVRMPGPTGFELVPHLLQIAPRARIIMLTTYEDDEYLARSFGGGAHGYLLKNDADERLADSIRSVHGGERIVTPQLMSKVLTQYRSLSQSHSLLESGMGAQELEILRALSRGASNAQIAREHFLGERTLKRRIRQIYAKLGASTRAQAIAEAGRRGLL